MLENLQLLTSLALVVRWEDLQNALVTTIIFVILGMVVFALAFFFITMITPFSVKKEIEEDQNIAVGIVIGSIIIGIAIIIAAAISGDGSGTTAAPVVVPTATTAVPVR